MTAPNCFELSLPNIAANVLSVGNIKNFTRVLVSLNRLAFLWCVILVLPPTETALNIILFSNGFETCRGWM